LESAGSQRENETETNLKKGPFWRKQENVARHRVRLRGWQVTELDGGDSHMHYVPYGTK